ncbi:hypothetical protein ACLGI4_15685 [Streptomyces sp. HMX112]|uniref:hypothetical protein n=1 Tax=Streptomyces sp. HMX112 TaxID=3390850 RepID=UPI003A7F9714
MALNAKWDELFGGDGTAAGMTLASATAPAGAGGGGDGGGPDLKADQGPWTSSGGVAGELRTTTATAVGELAGAHEGVVAGTEGFGSTATLNAVHDSWKTRLGAVRDECGRLEGALRSAGKDFGERETDTTRKMTSAAPGRPNSGSW